jgi:hypothetical protein
MWEGVVLSNRQQSMMQITRSLEGKKGDGEVLFSSLIRGTMAEGR